MQTTPRNNTEVLNAWVGYYNAIAAKAEKAASACGQCGVVAKLTAFEKPNRTGLELCPSCLRGAK